MKTCSICICLFLMAVAAGAAMAADLSACVVPVYFTGETGVKFGSGLVVGDGGYVVTSADLAQEKVGPNTSITVKFPIVLVPSTGEAYQAENVLVDVKGNVAVLKLPVKGLPAYPLADDTVVKSAPYITLGQMMTEDAPGGKWPAQISAWSRDKATGKFELKTWTTKNAFLTEAKGYNWLFLSSVSPADPIPTGAVVTTTGSSSAAAVYVSRFTIEGGQKPIELRMTAPAVTAAQALQKAGLSITQLRNPPAASYKPDGKESQVFQITSRAVSALIAGNWSTAVTEAKSLVDLRPDNARTQLLYGTALAGSGKSEDALKAFEKAVQLDPTMPGIYLNRGAAYASMKKVKEAETDYRKVMELSPRDIRPMTWLAALLSQDEKRAAESVQLAAKAANMEPDNPAARMALADAYAVSGEHEKSLAEIREALKISPAFTASRIALAIELSKVGKKDEAEKELRKLTEDEPKNPAVFFELAAFLKYEGKNEEAKTVADKILAMNPSAELKAAVEKLMNEKSDEKH